MTLLLNSNYKNSYEKMYLEEIFDKENKQPKKFIKSKREQL